MRYHVEVGKKVSSQVLKKKCPLCLSVQVNLLFTSARKKLERRYLSCDDCGLVFVPSQYQLTIDEQRDRYLEHNNSPTDPGYREFLSRLKNQMTPLPIRNPCCLKETLILWKRCLLSFQITPIGNNVVVGAGPTDSDNIKGTYNPDLNFYAFLKSVKLEKVEKVEKT